MPSFLCRDRYSDDDDQDKLHRRSAPCARPAAGHANFEPRARRAPAGGGNGVRRMTAASSFTLAELLICACAEVWAAEGEEIGRASCRERVWKYVKISVVAGSLKKKENIKN